MEFYDSTWYSRNVDLPYVHYCFDENSKIESIFGSNLICMKIDDKIFLGDSYDHRFIKITMFSMASIEVIISSISWEKLFIEYKRWNSMISCW